MWGWDDRPGSARSGRLCQHDEATASTAKIIPLRPWFDPPAPLAEDSLIKFADENSSAAEARPVAKTAGRPSAEPYLREVAKTQAKTQARTEAKPETKPETKPEAKIEAKTEAK